MTGVSDVAPLLVALGLLAACGDDEAPEPALPAVAVSAPAEAPAQKRLSPLQARREFLLQWSRCLERTGSRLERSWTRLQQDVDVEKLRVRNKALQPFFDPVDGEMLDACPLGTHLPEGVPEELATQGRTYVLAARRYGNRAKDLRQYFDTEGYVTDDWAKLQEDLPGLRAAYDAALAATASFSSRLEAAQDDADAQWLAELDRDGKAQSAAWHVTHTALKGRALRVCVTQERPIPEPCSAASVDFTRAREGLEQWRDGHPAEAPGVFWLDVFRKRAAGLEQAVAGLQVPVSTRKKTADVELAAAEQRILEARRGLAMAANTVVFDFP